MKRFDIPSHAAGHIILNTLIAVSVAQHIDHRLFHDNEGWQAA